jgi:tRNA pseudouridine55 synthase
MTGNILTTSPVTVTEDEVRAAASRFVGEIKQVPPMYSALKRDGHKLVDLARRGITVEREARIVTVYSLLVERLSATEYALTVECSKGTYIRTLCADIGAALGCGGAMQSLMRIKAAGFSIDKALTLDELSQMTEEERDAAVIDTEELFRDKPTLTLPPFFLRLVKNGCEIYQKKIGTHYETGSILRLYDEKGFFALGEVQEFSDGSAVKMIKLLREEH